MCSSFLAVQDTGPLQLLRKGALHKAGNTAVQMPVTAQAFIERLPMAPLLLAMAAMASRLHKSLGTSSSLVQA